MKDLQMLSQADYISETFHFEEESTDKLTSETSYEKKSSVPTCQLQTPRQKFLGRFVYRLHL